MSAELSDTLRRIERRRRGRAPRGPHRLAALCAALGDLHLAVPAVRVIGTDGKSSVARMVGACLDHAGVRTVVTTSPHLTCPSERIVVDGRAVAPTALLASLRRVTAVLPEIDRTLGERVTFFEVITATALDVAVASGVDAVVVEAGIGGCGDATAAIPARTVALTPVGRDHPELGDTPAAIAAEKVGVLPRRGMLVSGPQGADVLEVVAEVVASRGARWSRYGRDHGVRWRRATPDGQDVVLDAAFGSVRAWLPLLGAHQAANAATAVATAHAHLASHGATGATGTSCGLRPEDPRVRAALETVRLPGRSDRHITHTGVEVVLDGAHDEVAARALVATLRERPVTGSTRVVLGCRGGRSATDLIAILADVSPSAVEVVEPGVAHRAVQRALAVSRPGDRVVVTGSMHLVGEVRRGPVGVAVGASPVGPVEPPGGGVARAGRPAGQGVR